MDFFIKFNFILQLSVNKMVYNVNVKFIRRDILKKYINFVNGSINVNTFWGGWYLENFKQLRWHTFSNISLKKIYIPSK